MQIQVINDQDRDIAIAEIRRLNAVMAQFRKEGRTVYAEAYALCGLIDALEVRASRGHREILVLDCTTAQIQAVMEWRSWDEDGDFEDLVIHLVRKA
jgi:hypothetical protein